MSKVGGRKTRSGDADVGGGTRMVWRPHTGCCFASGDRVKGRFVFAPLIRGE